MWSWLGERVKKFGWVTGLALAVLIVPAIHSAVPRELLELGVIALVVGGVNHWCEARSRAQVARLRRSGSTAPVEPDSEDEGDAADRVIDEINALVAGAWTSAETTGESRGEL